MVLAQGVAFEEAVEGREIVLGGGEFGVVDPVALEDRADALAVPPAEFAVGHADVLVAGVHDPLVAVLVVAQDDPSDVREAFLGEHGALAEHAVFDLFYNYPLTVRRRLRLKAALREDQPERWRHLPMVIACAAGALVLIDTVYWALSFDMPTMKSL